MYVCIYVCMYVCMYVCIHVVCICIRTCMLIDEDTAPTNFMVRDKRMMQVIVYVCMIYRLFSVPLFSCLFFMS